MVRMARLARRIDNGTPADDTIVGTNSRDFLNGGLGNDIISGLGAVDFINGEQGNDTIDAGSANDRVQGGRGDDVIDGGLGRDELFGEGGNDTIFGGQGADRIFAGDDDDTVFGGAGNDRILAGSGNDKISGEEGNDRIFGLDGNDVLDGGILDDQLYGQNGNDELLGGSGNDRLEGGAGNDTADGGAGDDIILGEDGVDTLDGGAGNDVVDGGAGDDIFAAGAGNDAVLGGAGKDTLNFVGAEDEFTTYVAIAAGGVVTGFDANGDGDITDDDDLVFNATSGNLDSVGGTADVIKGADFSALFGDGDGKLTAADFEAGDTFYVDADTAANGNEGTTLVRSVESIVFAGGENPDDKGGVTKVLTTSIDNVTGTTSNDTVQGVFDNVTATNNTFSAADNIDLGAGDGDSIEILVNDVNAANDQLPVATVKNVERVFIRNIDAANEIDVNTAGFQGATQFWNDRSSAGVDFDNVATGSFIGIRGNSLLTLSKTTADFVAAATTANVLFSNGTVGTADVILSGSGLTTVNILSQVAANTTGFIDVAGAKTVNVTATTALTAKGIVTTATDATLTISGAGAVSLGTLDDGFDTVTATGATGGVTLVLDGEGDTKVALGSGNDTITTAFDLTTGSVDAGTGTDTLIVDTTTRLQAGRGAKYTGFETLSVLDGVAVDLDDIAGITSIIITDDLSLTEVTDLSAAQALAITARDIEGAFTIGVKGAATVGQIDTVKITVDDGDSTTSEDITAAGGTPTLTGIENLTLVAVDDVEIFSLFNAASLTNVTLSGAGDVSLTTGGVAFAANSVINASGLTGQAVIDASVATTNGLSITGGSNADGDKITGTAQNDSLTGGEGTDIITSGKGSDAINLTETTAVADQVNFDVADTGADSITGFAAGAGADKVGVANAFTQVGTAAGNDAVFATESTALTAAGTTFNLASSSTANDVIELLTTLDDDVTLSATSTGADLLEALTSDAGAATGITVAADQDEVLLVVYQGGNAFLWSIAETSDGGSVAAAAEIDLVAVFNGVAAGELTAGDFVII